MSSEIEDKVKDYYGKVLETNEDLLTSACCPLEAPPAHVQALRANVHEKVQEKFYGCGSPIPADVQGATILDLGCGSGQDAYILSQIVGEDGHVIGVDMTEEQLAVANQHISWHMDQFGYAKPNVEFKQGYIEDLQAAGVADDSVDVVISNCVINLSPDKEKVFSEIFRVLKPGGELYFSDVFSGQVIPEALQTDKILLGECLGGAMTLPDFETMVQDIGMTNVSVESKRDLVIDDPAVKKKIGMIDFYSVTVQAFKGEPKRRGDSGCAPSGGCC